MQNIVGVLTYRKRGSNTIRSHKDMTDTPSIWVIHSDPLKYSIGDFVVCATLTASFFFLPNLHYKPVNIKS